MPLRNGQKAPAFDVVSSTGQRISLAGDLIGKKNVVLYFYPGDFTPVCTKEACGFRDLYDDLANADTEIIGVSVDSDESHRRFADRYKVPFALVSDPNRELAKAYGATGLLGNILKKAGRITFVIDKKGEIAGVFESAFNAAKHVESVKDLLRKLG